MAQLFTYKAFGLVINSEFEISELLVHHGIPDVEIMFGKTPQELGVIKYQGVKYQASKNEFLLEVDNIAKYYVKGGNKITVEILKENRDKEVRLFLLGSAFGALFLQRGLLPIHGSTIKFGETATVFTGLSGVGKSSIAAYFISRGYKALADDISVVNNNLEVVPGFPNLKIWDDVLTSLEIQNNSLEQVRQDLKKYQVPISTNFYNECLPLKNIIILSTRNSSEFDSEELTGIRKFNAVRNNTYRNRFVKGLEKQQDQFLILNMLLAKTKVIKIYRPQSPIMLQELGEFIVKLLKQDV